MNPEETNSPSGAHPDKQGPLPLRVVLVETEYAGNLGSVARVMRNMGVEDLVLVRPKANKGEPAALRMAVHAGSLLENARVVQTLSEALADCVEAAATGARVDGPVREIKKGFPRDIIPDLLAAAGTGGDKKVALVFGPEPSGLTTSDVALCHHLIKIPSTIQYSSLNLAMAVGVCCYEARMAWLSGVPRARVEPELSMRAQELLHRHVRRALEAVGYLYGEKQDTLMHGISHLLGRLKPGRRDAGMIHGLARQILWYVRTHPHLDESLAEGDDSADAG